MLSEAEPFRPVCNNRQFSACRKSPTVCKPPNRDAGTCSEAGSEAGTICKESQTSRKLWRDEFDNDLFGLVIVPPGRRIHLHRTLRLAVDRR